MRSSSIQFVPACPSNSARVQSHKASIRFCKRSKFWDAGLTVPTDETLSSLGSSESGGVVGNEASGSEDGDELGIGGTEGPSHSEKVPSDGDNSGEEGSGDSSGGDWCNAEPTADSTRDSAEGDMVIVGNSSLGGYNSRPIRQASSEWGEERYDISVITNDQTEGEGALLGGDNIIDSRYCWEGGDITLDSPDSEVLEMGDDPPTDMSFTHNKGGADKIGRDGKGLVVTVAFEQALAI